MDSRATATVEPAVVSNDEPVCLFENPHRLVSLWDIVKLFRLDEYHEGYDRFQELIFAIDGEMIQGNLQVTDAQRRAFKEVLLLLKDQCEKLALDDSIHVMIARAIGLSELEGVSKAILAERLQSINFLFGTRCDRHKFFTLTESESLKFENSKLFGNAVAAAFPSEEFTYEVKEVGSCFALGRYTATVFHLMRVLEKGLKALANELTVPFSTPFDYLNWQNIIESIECEIKNLEKLKAGKYKADTLKAYSEIAKQFRYFKDAWRNGVAHSRETYTKVQARSILAHVGEFMNDIVKLGIRESRIVP